MKDELALKLIKQLEKMNDNLTVITIVLSVIAGALFTITII